MLIETLPPGTRAHLVKIQLMDGEQIFNYLLTNKTDYFQYYSCSKYESMVFYKTRPQTNLNLTCEVTCFRTGNCLLVIKKLKQALAFRWSRSLYCRSFSKINVIWMSSRQDAARLRAQLTLRVSEVKDKLAVSNVRKVMRFLLVVSNNVWCVSARDVAS